MAYTSEISALEIKRMNAEKHKIVFRVVLKDDGVTTFTKEYTCEHIMGQSAQGAQSQLLAQVKADWDEHAAAQTMIASNAMSNAITSMQTKINNYMNG